MAEVWTHRKEKAYSKNTHSEENWPAVPFLLAQCELSCVLNLAILRQKCGLPETKGQAGLLTSEVLGRDKEKDWGQQTLARSHPQMQSFLYRGYSCNVQRAFKSTGWQGFLTPERAWGNKTGWQWREQHEHRRVWGWQMGRVHAVALTNVTLHAEHALARADQRGQDPPSEPGKTQHRTA